MADRQMLRIRYGFAVPQKHTTRLKIYKGGEVVWSDDPIVKGRDECFEPYNPIERTTGRPGEMRAVKPKAQRMADEAAKAEAKGDKKEKKAAKAEAKGDKKEKKAAKAEAKGETAANSEESASEDEHAKTPDTEGESNEGATVGLTTSSLKGEQ